MKGVEYTLVVLETAHIQSYIFKSNRLRENVGASYLVAAVTEEWVYEAVRTLGLAHNIADEGGFTTATIDRLDVEILYCGGGNAVLMFADVNDARDFVRQLSRWVLTDAPGLRLTVYCQSVDWAQQPLSYQVSEALDALRQQRSFQPPQLGVHGLGVTAMCATTSLPAVTMDRDPDNNWEAISAESAAKRRAVHAANEKLHEAADEVLKDCQHRYEFPLDFDDLGRTEGESSFIAVVHADGNDMGMLLQSLKKDYPTPAHNRLYIEAVRSFSEKVKRASQLALDGMLRLLTSSIDEDTADGRPAICSLTHQANIVLREKRDHTAYFLPFRPLVSGGDDITFVCDGRIGIDLALQFVKWFEAASEEVLGRRLTACAGVAIVNAHYPFARAYELAEKLCQSAKHERHLTRQLDSSLIDWHISMGGLYDELKEMRKRDYTVREGWLYLRPLFVDENPAYPQRSWPTVQRVVTEFQTKWRSHRSKAKDFMEVLRQGEAQADAFQKRYLDGKGLALPLINGMKRLKTWNQWDDEEYRRCLYYDALELMDLYIPILEGEADRVP